MFDINNKKTKSTNNKNTSIIDMAKRLIAPFIQLILSIVLISLIIKSNLLPTLYIGIIIFILFACLFATTGSQFLKQKFIRIVALILSIIISIISIFGIYSLNTATTVIGEISGATYKINNMIVSVLVDDPAEDLFDAKDYTFGVQNYTDTENNELMIDSMEEELEQSISVVTYDNIISLATALLNGDIDAVIYNEAFESVIEENLEEYEGAVKTIHQYGIEVEIESTTDTETSTDTEVEEEVVTDLSISESSFNIYLSGIDVYGSISNTSRSDVNIIMSVNTVTKEILLINTPRDYYVQIPGITGDSYDKLTHAGIYGIDYSVSTLEALYDITIDYYAKVNFTSLVDIVDALGGINVYSEYSFTTSSGSYSYASGYNYMYGEEALAFCRSRNFSDGDNQRGKNQQQVIISILDKVMTPSVLTGIDTIISSVSSNVKTNMSDSDLSELIKMQLEDGASWTISTVSATGTNGSASCYSLGGLNSSIIYQDEDVVSSISEQIKALLEID